MLKSFNRRSNKNTLNTNNNITHKNSAKKSSILTDFNLTPIIVKLHTQSESIKPVRQNPNKSKVLQNIKFQVSNQTKILPLISPTSNPETPVIPKQFIFSSKRSSIPRVSNSISRSKSPLLASIELLSSTNIPLKPAFSPTPYSQRNNKNL